MKFMKLTGVANALNFMKSISVLSLLNGMDIVLGMRLIITCMS